MKTLKAQIIAALVLIMLLFGGISTLSIMALNEQQGYNTLLNITTRLEQTARSLVSLGMNYSYSMYSPREKNLQTPDVQLYYRAIHDQMDALDKLTMSFMTENFDPSLTKMDTAFSPQFSPETQRAVLAVEEIWIEFRQGITQALGDQPDSPKLNAAALYIANFHSPLIASIDVLLEKIHGQTENRLNQVFQLHWAMKISFVFIAIGIFAWFYKVILTPLNSAVKGFNKVSQGDFGFQVPIRGHDELGQMTEAFNQLSSRLHSIFRLIDYLQQGSDLDETLDFVAREFPKLLPLDWVGALFVGGDNSTIVLERSYRNGKPEISSRYRFRLDQTLLMKALESGEPLHIPNMLNTANQNPEFQFLNFLTAEGLRDAIFLPVIEQSPIPSVLVFATTEANTYNPEHLELLTNIAGLITHSFSRTVRLAEHSRLAAIGGFASGIAHEIRSPLSTISMALDYFRTAELPGSASKRADLAYREAKRMARLLEEMLLYAKPMQLDMQKLDVRDLLDQLIETYQELPSERAQRFEVEYAGPEFSINGDKDKLIQTFLNLARNACDAAPEGGVIDWKVSRESETNSVRVAIRNGGDPIPAEKMEHLFEPFFTTKASGTGLGLGIVKRIVDAHGGDIQIQSSKEAGTLVQLRFPLTSN